MVIILFFQTKKSEFVSAGYNNLEVARFLLENGAEVNLKDKGGLIPLHNASSFGHLEIAGLLIEYGAEVNHPDKWGYTPLHEAAQKVIVLLLETYSIYIYIYIY